MNGVLYNTYGVIRDAGLGSPAELGTEGMFDAKESLGHLLSLISEGF